MNQLKLTAIAALFAVAAFRTNADTTNLVQDVSIQLTGYRQGAPRTNSTSIVVGVDSTSVGTAGVIAALGAATGNSFSTGALFTKPVRLSTSTLALVIGSRMITYIA